MNVDLGLLFAQDKAPADAKAAEPKVEVKAAGAKPVDAKAADAKVAVEKPVEGDAGVAVAPKAAAPQGTGEFLQMFAPFILIAVVFYLLILRPQRKEQSTREDMLKQLKKNDRVLTIGGIIGTVSNISDDGKEVTVKIDDNAKMHVVRSAIQQVFVDKDTKDAKA